MQMFAESVRACITHKFSGKIASVILTLEDDTTEWPINAENVNET